MNVTFYSYKGGVGRTTVLVNTSILLAQASDKRVGMIDLDLEAPSMHVLFGLDLNPNQSILRTLCDRDLEILSNRVIDLAKENKEVSIRINENRCFLVPCLPDYSLANEVTDKVRSGDFETLIQDFKQAYGLDYLFLDSRPGYTPLSGIANVLADKVVLVFRLDEQNLLGIKDAYNLLHEKARKKVILVANEVPSHPKARKYQERFEEQLETKIDLVINLDEQLLFGNTVPSLKFPKEHDLNIKYLDLIQLLE